MSRTFYFARHGQVDKNAGDPTFNTLTANGERYRKRLPRMLPERSIDVKVFDKSAKRCQNSVSEVLASRETSYDLGTDKGEEGIKEVLGNLHQNEHTVLFGYRAESYDTLGSLLGNISISGNSAKTEAGWTKAQKSDLLYRNVFVVECLKRDNPAPSKYKDGQCKFVEAIPTNQLN